MPTTLGAHSPVLDRVRALKTKAGRRESGRFAIEGPTMLEEALRSGVTPAAVYATEPAYDGARDLLAPLEPSVPVSIVPERAMARISDLETPPGLLAVCATATLPLAELLALPGPVMLLAGVGDPGNAGTLMRSAEIFGFTGIIFGHDAVEPYNPKVVRASMGAIFRLPAAVAGADEIAAAARSADYELVATGDEGEPLDRFVFRRRSVIAIGNERRGVRGWLERWDRTATIPQHGSGESLNAAVAGSIVAYVASTRLAERAETPGGR
jgi:TrmH family RNA methyltransferase